MLTIELSFGKTQQEEFQSKKQDFYFSFRRELGKFFQQSCFHGKRLLKNILDESISAFCYKKVKTPQSLPAGNMQVFCSKWLNLSPVVETSIFFFYFIFN